MIFKNTTFQIDTDMTDIGRPLIVPTMSESPCKRRPDTLEPCPILEHTKNNPYCATCRFIRQGLAIHPPAVLVAAIEAGKIIDPKDAATKKRCEFPGCQHGTTRHYCRDCGKLVVSRRQAYTRKHGKGPVPLEILHAPKRPVGRLPANAMKGD